MAYAIIGILAVAFIAFVVLSAKAWHWSNIVFLSLCFLTGLGGLISMSQVLEKRRAQMIEVKKSREQLERLESDIETVRYGAGFSFEYSPDSLLGLSEALELEQAGRGRVWKTGVIEATGANRTFRFTANRVQSEDKPAQMQDMLLYAFADQQFEGGVIYPLVFVGSFRVSVETPNSLELEPVHIVQTQEYESPSTTWTLFEKAPPDQRDAFIRNTDIVLEDQDPNLNQKLNEYREILTSQFLPADLFGFDLNDDAQAKEYELFIDRMMFDGLPLVKIESWIESQTERIAKRFDPENEEIFVRFRFDSPSTRPYQVDSSGNIETDGQFTQNGQAVDPSLHAGGEITFQQGDEIYVDQLTADGYQRGDEVVPRFSDLEPVTEVERIFRRRLRDYPFLLRSLQRKRTEYIQEIARVEQNNLRSQQAIADTQNQSNQRDAMIDLLLEDQEKFQQDVDTATTYMNQLRLSKDEVESRLAALEKEIRKSHRRIKAISTKIASLKMTTSSSDPNAMESIAPSGNEWLPANESIDADLETAPSLPLEVIEN